MAKKPAIRPSAKKKDEVVRLYTVVNKAGLPVYGVARSTDAGLLYQGVGTDLSDAVRLAKGLVEPSGVALIGPDNILYGGSVDDQDKHTPSFSALVDVPWPTEED
jgi:hypothetical protein